MIDLMKYGFTEKYELEMNQAAEGLLPARIIQVHRERYRVVCELGEGNARLKGSFYNNLELSQDFPAVGDFVLIKYNELGDSQIVKLCKRSSKFSRTDYSGHAIGYVKTILEQVVAANFDYVFILASLNYDFNINRIIRYVTAAWESGGIPVVILTKADLEEDFEQKLNQVRDQASGVEVVALSAVTGMGLEQLSDYLQPGKTIVFLGSSGVGKSTLVNTLAGEEIMNVNMIREDDSKGRHTTTHRQLNLLKNGVMIIDTPGMRELGMWDVSEGIQETFSEIEELISKCKFSDCTHDKEPGCAIQSALEVGALEKSRWKNYLQLRNEARFTKDKSAYLKQKKETFKKINMHMKQRCKGVNDR